MTFLFFCLGMLAGIIIVCIYAAALNWRDARRDREKLERADAFAKEQANLGCVNRGAVVEIPNTLYASTGRSFDDIDAEVRGQRKGLAE